MKRVSLGKGFVNVVSNGSIFILQNDQLRIFALVYVDDIPLIGANAQFIDEWVSKFDNQIPWGGIVLKSVQICIIFIDKNQDEWNQFSVYSIVGRS